MPGRARSSERVENKGVDVGCGAEQQRHQLNGLRVRIAIGRTRNERIEQIRAIASRDDDDASHRSGRVLEVAAELCRLSLVLAEDDEVIFEELLHRLLRGAGPARGRLDPLPWL